VDLDEIWRAAGEVNAEEDMDAFWDKVRRGHYGLAITGITADYGPKTWRIIRI
jgi:hypothetical protein